MTSEGRVYDLGYTPHEGERLGRSGAMRAILKDGLRRAMGIRRKARTKILPWLLTGFAMIPAVVMLGLIFLLAGFTLPDGGAFASHANYFNLIGGLSMLFVAFVAPSMLIPDRKHGVLAIYASRPVRASDYLVARAGALVILVSAYILIPHVLLYIGKAALDPLGLWAGLTGNLSEVPAIIGTTFAFVLGYGSMAFLVSVYVQRVATATGVFVMTMFLLQGVSESIPTATDNVIFTYLAPLSMVSNPLTVRDWFFGIDGNTPLVRAGLPSWVALASLIVFAVLTGYLAHRRYRREL